MSLPKIIILGAGLGGTIAAYEIRDALKGKAELTVVNDSEDYWFVPSNPWVAVRWREPEAIKAHLPPSDPELFPSGIPPKIPGF